MIIKIVLLSCLAESLRLRPCHTQFYRSATVSVYLDDIVIIKTDLVSVVTRGRYCLSYASLKLTRTVTDFLTCVLLLNHSSHVHRFLVLLR